jgi:hypothetical protein
MTTDNKESEPTPITPKLRGKGRPPKSDLQAVKDRTKGKLGRPKGDASRIQEFKERLLATGGNRIIDKMVSIAMDDGHQGQMAALKLCIDRLLPVSLFEANKNGGSVPTVTINIQGLDSPAVAVVEDVTDVEVKEYGES